MHEQIRKDLDTADRVVRACWGNFAATEPTYVLRDLIVVEIQKAREAEREACARIADEHPHTIHMEVSSFEACAVHVKDEIAAAIRHRSNLP